jgi:hypothetical protein
VTGMSGTGKSSALAELGRRGYRVVDTDDPGWREYPAVVLLSAPADVLLDRIARRTTNDYGKTQVERAMILDDLTRVEPLLRASCTHELDASRQLAEVVADLIAIASRPMTTSSEDDPTP